MKNLFYLSVTSFCLLMFTLFSCSKEGNETANSPKEHLQFLNNINNQVDLNLVQKYHDAIIYGIQGLLNDTLFINSALQIAMSTDSLSEKMDFYAHLDEISSVFESNERDLYAVMLDNISAQTMDQSIISIFQSNGFSFQNGFYDFRPRLFLIHLDENNYSQPIQIAKLLFSNYTLGAIPVWSRDISIGNFSLDTFNVSILESLPIWVVSSSIYDIRSNLALDNVALEAGGKKKCKKSATTGWCVNSGKKCKCEYGDPIDNAQFIQELFDSFVNGTLGEEFYISN